MGFILFVVHPILLGVYSRKVYARSGILLGLLVFALPSRLTGESACGIAPFVLTRLVMGCSSLVSCFREILMPRTVIPAELVIIVGLSQFV
jgi:hypothetical protein